MIRMLTGSLRPNNITSVMGIINGTTNYILSQMDQFGTGYKAALAKAQELGYAEADPTADVEGFDAAYKLCILCGLAFGARVKVDDVLREGISKLSAMDIEMAHELGYVIKLLGIGKQHNGGVEARVHPVMIPKTNPLASVGGPFNGVLIGADAAGDLMLYGRGSGDLPTASAMVSDAINVAQGKAAELVEFTPAPWSTTSPAAITSVPWRPIPPACFTGSRASLPSTGSASNPVFRRAREKALFP